LSQTDAPPLKVADIPASPAEPDAAAELMAAQTSGAPRELRVDIERSVVEERC